MKELERVFVKFLADLEPDERDQFVANLSQDHLRELLKEAYLLADMREKSAGSRARGRFRHPIPVTGVVIDAETGIPGMIPPTPQKKPKFSKPRKRESVVETVERLLRVDSKLTVRDSVDGLCQFLKIPKPNAKKSFRWQIEKISEQVGTNKLLKAAYQLRTEVTGYEPQLAWPI